MSHEPRAMNHRAINSKPGSMGEKMHGEREDERKRYSDGAHARRNVLFVDL